MSGVISMKIQKFLNIYLIKKHECPLIPSLIEKYYLISTSALHILPVKSVRTPDLLKEKFHSLSVSI